MEPMYRGIPFSPQTTLTATIGAADTVIPVADVSVFPDPPNYATIGIDADGETISYSAKTDNALSGCTRGVEGTPKSWASGSVIARNFTAKDLESLQKNLREVGRGVQADWGENDETKLSYVKGRTHWAEGSGGGEVILETAIPSTLPPEFVDHGALSLEIGKSYRVTLNGEESVHECRGPLFGDTAYIGNATLIKGATEDMGEDTGESFVILDEGDRFTIFWGYTLDYGFTIKVESSGEVIYHPLRREYIPNGVPYAETAKVGQTIVVSEVDAAGKPTKWEAADPQQSGKLEFYTEDGGSAKVVNKPDQDNPVWSELPAARLGFGMNKASAPVPFVVDGQLLVNGTVIARNMADNNHSDFDRNRWGMHVFEAYATDDWARLTMLLDKHTDPETGRKMAEIYYYVQASHNESSYGPVKIGSDVALHSFDFSRDKFVANGEIIGKMPITLARISLTDDIDNTYETVAEVDAAYEPETHSVENVRCLKYIALKNAKDGAMFYDADRNRLVAKINTKWCDVPFEAIKDDRYEIFGQGSNAVYCTSVTLDKTEITLTKMDDVTLTPTILPENTTETPVWQSSDNGVAKVSNGVITPIADGTAVITVTVGSQMASCTVTVDIKATLVGNGLEFYLNLRNMADKNSSSTQIVDSVGGVVCTTPSVAFDNTSGFVTNDGLMLPTASTKLQWQYPVKTANVPNGYTYEITTKGLGDFNGAGDGFGNGYAHLFDFSDVLGLLRAQLSRRDSDNAIIQTWGQQTWTKVLENAFYTNFDATQEHVYTNVCEADGSSKVYVDGVLAYIHASDGNFDHYNLQGLVKYIIPYSTTKQTPMEVAAVRIYERALSADEVLQNAKFDASQRSLI